jgi:cytoskeletal protein RodZ
VTTIGLLQESTSTMDISWLVWVILAIFVLMVFLGWWASARLPKEDETIHLHNGDHDGTASH